MELETTIHGERFVHKTLWATVLKMMANADPPGIGTSYDLLAAMVFAAHAFEAYLNYVGLKLDPVLWKNERKYFLREPFRGLEGKIRKVLEMVDLPEPSRDCRPYRTIFSLKLLRDTIAHGHVIPIDEVVVHSQNERPPVMSWIFDLKVPRQLSLEAIEDVEDIAKRIHAAALIKVDDPWFVDVPFGGAHSWAGHSTKVKDR